MSVKDFSKATSTKVRVLAVIRHFNVVTIKEISNHCDLSIPIVTRHVDSMIQEGLLKEHTVSEGLPQGHCSFKCGSERSKTIKRYNTYCYFPSNYVTLVLVKQGYRNQVKVLNGCAAVIGFVFSARNTVFS